MIDESLNLSGEFRVAGMHVQADQHASICRARARPRAPWYRRGRAARATGPGPGEGQPRTHALWRPCAHGHGRKDKIASDAIRVASPKSSGLT